MENGQVTLYVGQSFELQTEVSSLSLWAEERAERGMAEFRVIMLCAVHGAIALAAAASNIRASTFFACSYV